MLHRYGIVYYEVMISISLDKRLGVHCSNIYIYFFFVKSYYSYFLNSGYIYRMRDRKVKCIQYMKEKWLYDCIRNTFQFSLKIAKRDI